jgi:putative transposase
VCEALGVCRSAYYAWRDGPPSPRGEETTRLTAQIAAIFWRHKRRYGARRIAAELADRGVVCSARRVANVLKSQGLRAIQPKSFVPKTTDSRHTLGFSPNLVLDAPEPVGIDRLWVGEIVQSQMTKPAGLAGRSHGKCISDLDGRSRDDNAVHKQLGQLAFACEVGFVETLANTF